MGSGSVAVVQCSTDKAGARRYVPSLRGCTHSAEAHLNGEARATTYRRETPGASTSAVKAMQAGSLPGGTQRYADLVGRHQRRASQIAFHYLRDDAAADEAVQDAFVEAYAYLASLPEELPFELWLNRI